MKSAGEILHELGFNKMASDSAKEAFLRHLIKNGTGVSPQPRQLSQPVKLQQNLEQLSFNFGNSTEDLREAI